MQQQKTQSTTTSMHSNSMAKPERITQLQCVNQSFKYLPNILAKIYNEIQLIVALAEYRLTIAVGRPHPADHLQNIKYAQNSMSKGVKIAYLFLSVILPYIKRKIHNYVIQNPIGWKEKILNLFNIVDKILLVLDLINLSVFINNGIYRTISQRVLKIPMQFINGESGRILDFSLMNRRLIWSVYELFLKTVLPFAHGLFGSTLKNIFYLNSYLNAQTENKSKCVICGEKAKLPMKASCEHLACYFCYATQVLGKSEQGIQQAGYKCKECGDEIKNWKKLY